MTPPPAAPIPGIRLSALAVNSGLNRLVHLCEAGGGKSLLNYL